MCAPHRLRENNPHFQFYWASAEWFMEHYGKLQAVVPRDHGEVPVRLSRKRPDGSTVDLGIDLRLSSIGFYFQTLTIDPAHV